MLPSNQKYLVFDTETEGLNLHSSKTWQLSWIVCQGKNVIETHDKFIKHKELNIPEVVRKLTGFDWDKYNQKAESLISVWSQFEQYLFDPQYIVVGQNLLGFDVYMISHLQRMLGQEPDYSYLPRIYDTRALGKAYREELDKPKRDFLGWQYKIMNDRSLKAKVSQNQLLKFFDIDF
jgi:DNA polymerase III alpha subunit (gram-positive type)